MKKEEIVNRLSGLFDQGLGKMQDVGKGMDEKFRAGTKIIVEGAEKTWNEGRDQVLNTERRLVGTVKQYPSVFILAGLSLMGLFFAKMLYDSQSRTRL